MKKVLLLLATAAIVCGGFTACSNAQANKTTGDNEAKVVYICTGGSATRYHASKNCKGLSNCGGAIREVTIEQAEKMGRTPCKICY